MQTLNDVYNDATNTDNDVLIRTLNTFIESDNSEQIYKYTKYFVILFENLKLHGSVKRINVDFVCDKINALESNSSFSNYVTTLKEIYKYDIKNFKFLFVMCYCRSKFELFYNDHISYKNPKYATMEALGKNSWNIFLSSLQNNDFVYIE